MFKDKLKKAIPKTINECAKSDSVSDQLLQWTDSISAIGKIILCLNLIVGLAMSILVGVLAWELTDDYVSWFWPFLIGIIITAINVLIIHLIFQFVTMLFSALSSLVLNTRVTADVDLYMASKEKEEVKDTEGTNKGTISMVPSVAIPVEQPVITDEATLEEYKKKIDEFLLDAGKCVRVSELRECWENLDLGRHPVVENIGKEILEAEKIERMYGFSNGRVAKTVEKITSYYLMAKFRKEI